MLLAVPNVSEGRDRALVAEIAGNSLLADIHSDVDHHRSVLTYMGRRPELVEACVSLVARAADLIDLRTHSGAHPRSGVVDVLPFVPYKEQDDEGAVDCATAAGARIANQLSIPVYLYGRASPAGRHLPEVRRSIADLPPDLGPRLPHPTAGVTCVGVREPLVAFNVNLQGAADDARVVAGAVRGPHVRALGFDLPSRGLVQVSMNLIEPLRVGPMAAFQRVSELAAPRGMKVADAEIVGLVPAIVLEQCDRLPLRSPARSIESLCG